MNRHLFFIFRRDERIDELTWWKSVRGPLCDVIARKVALLLPYGLRDVSKTIKLAIQVKCLFQKTFINLFFCPPPDCGCQIRSDV